MVLFVLLLELGERLEILDVLVAFDEVAFDAVVEVWLLLLEVLAGTYHF